MLEGPANPSSSMSSQSALVHELATTLHLLQDTYGAVRRKEAELEALQLAHAEELKAKQLEIDSLHARLLLNQIMQIVKPGQEACAPPSTDDYVP